MSLRQAKRWAPPIALLALCAVLFAPTLAWLARTWRVHPYYSHGALVPVVAAWFAWRARARLVAGQPDDAGLVLVAAGVGLHVAAVRWEAWPLSAGGILLLLLGLAGLVGGRTAMRATAWPVVLLATAIPLPQVERLAPPLAAAVARGAAASAGALGVGVAQAGAQLSLADGVFVVGAPCSGLRSIVALCTVALVLAGALDGPRHRRLALVAAAVPLAVAANGLRLTALLLVADRFGPTVGLEVFHGPGGPLAFLCATFGLVIVGRTMGCDVAAPR